MFNRKRIEKLEKDLKGVNDENDRLRRELNMAAYNMQELLQIKQTTTEDCIPGVYCEACQFGKFYHVRHYVSGYTVGRCYDHEVSGYICDKANSCKNFVQKYPNMHEG